MSGSTLSPWRFSSKRSDPETKLVYYGNRFYRPDLGRWLTPDPAGFVDGMNLYAFVNNEPLMHLDQYGLWIQKREPGSFRASDTIRNWNNQVGQFSTGFNQGVMNCGFSTLKFANTIVHAAASPFHSFDLQNRRFNFSMGSSYGSIDNWLTQKQSALNNGFFSGRDSNSWGFKIGGFASGFATDVVAFGGACKVVKGSYGFVCNLMRPVSQEISTLTMLSSRTTGIAVSNEKVLLNFTNTAGKHMYEFERRIPVHTLSDIIKSPIAVVKDLQGSSNALMYYSQIWKNKKLYNAEVLYDEGANMISHFQYTQKNLGPLKKVSK